MKLSKYALYISPNANNEDANTAFYNPLEATPKNRRHLPHWDQPEKFFFVTFRLADSIPQNVLEQLREVRETWLTQHPTPWDEKTEAEYYEKFYAFFEKFLDNAHGSCILKEERICRIVHGTLRHFDGIRYDLSCFVIMPNHVHILLKVNKNYKLPDILFSWKSFSAHAINKLRKTSGPVWQSESWDRIIRSRAHFERVFRYILDNPQK